MELTLEFVASPYKYKRNIGLSLLMSELNEKMKPRRELVWSNVIILSVMHSALFYVFYLRIFHGLKFHLYHITHVLTLILGITVGYHRLWSHKSFRAHRGLEIVLMIMACGTYQNSCYDWARDHRVHHKYSETDADPHNARRGFFFSHMGWLLVRKHPDVKEKGKHIDMSDLEANPIVMFQHKYYYPLVGFFAFILPTCIWHHATGHTIFLSVLITLYRLTLTLNLTWGVNSFAHLYGMKPYTKNLGPAENLYVVATTGGEGFHNYHHTFPHDYKASFKNGDPRNIAGLFIDICQWVGIASDLKFVPEETVNLWSEKYGINSDYNKAHTFRAKMTCCAILFVALISL